MTEKHCSRTATSAAGSHRHDMRICISSMLLLIFHHACGATDPQACPPDTRTKPAQHTVGQPAKAKTFGGRPFQFHCEDSDTVAACKLAIQVVDGNIQPWQRGLLEGKVLALMAGSGYASPWTRDASYNTYFAAGLLWPEVARNTLLSVLEQHGDQIRIGGQYWDSVAWVTGAWEYYAITGDAKFLPIALDAAVNTLAYFEQTEFNLETGLFFGPGWSDGVAGYPAPYNKNPSSFILDYARDNPQVDKIRMQALSTNCLYYNAYRLTARMGRALNRPAEELAAWEAKAAALKRAINGRLWLPEKGLYAFFLDRRGQLETSSESLGQAFAILFGVASTEQAKQIFQHQYVSPHGIPCSWPVFPRFGHDIGRHSGAVWPQIQGFWALAVAARGRSDLLAHELLSLGHSALASGDFREIYHPQTGVPNGGLQTGRRWKSQPGQSWAATAYLAMLLRGVVGMRFEPDGIGLQPNLLERLGKVELRNIKYRQSVLDITLTGHGTQIDRFTIDRIDQPRPWIPATLKGRHQIEIECIAAASYPKHSEKTGDAPL